MTILSIHHLKNQKISSILNNKENPSKQFYLQQQLIPLIHRQKITTKKKKLK